MLPLRIESQYFGSIQYIKQLASAKMWSLIYMNHLKNELSQSNLYCECAGATLLTVPLQNGRDQKLPIYEVKISYSENWPSKHLKAISSCYKRSPFLNIMKMG